MSQKRSHSTDRHDELSVASDNIFTNLAALRKSNASGYNVQGYNLLHGRHTKTNTPSAQGIEHKIRALQKKTHRNYRDSEKIMIPTVDKFKTGETDFPSQTNREPMKHFSPILESDQEEVNSDNRHSHYIRTNTPVCGITRLGGCHHPNRISPFSCHHMLRSPGCQLSAYQCSMLVSEYLYGNRVRLKHQLIPGEMNHKNSLRCDKSSKQQVKKDTDSIKPDINKMQPNLRKGDYGTNVNKEISPVRGSGVTAHGKFVPLSESQENTESEQGPIEIGTTGERSLSAFPCRRFWLTTPRSVVPHAQAGLVYSSFRGCLRNPTIIPPLNKSARLNAGDNLQITGTSKTRRTQPKAPKCRTEKYNL